MAKSTILNRLKSKTVKVLKNIIQFIAKYPLLIFVCELMGNDIYQFIKTLLFNDY